MACGILQHFPFQRVYVVIGRQVQRIETVRQSPVFANFSETLNGLSSIRSYRQQTRFIEKADKLLNDDVRTRYLLTVSGR